MIKHTKKIVKHPKKSLNDGFIKMQHYREKMANNKKIEKLFTKQTKNENIQHENIKSKFKSSTSKIVKVVDVDKTKNKEYTPRYLNKSSLIGPTYGKFFSQVRNFYTKPLNLEYKSKKCNINKDKLSHKRLCSSTTKDNLPNNGILRWKIKDVPDMNSLDYLRKIRMRLKKLHCKKRDNENKSPSLHTVTKQFSKTAFEIEQCYRRNQVSKQLRETVLITKYFLHSLTESNGKLVYIYKHQLPSFSKKTLLHGQVKPTQMATQTPKTCIPKAEISLQICTPLCSSVNIGTDIGINKSTNTMDLETNFKETITKNVIVCDKLCEAVEPVADASVGANLNGFTEVALAKSNEIFLIKSNLWKQSVTLANICDISRSVVNSAVSITGTTVKTSSGSSIDVNADTKIINSKYTDTFSLKPVFSKQTFTDILKVCEQSCEPFNYIDNFKQDNCDIFQQTSFLNINKHSSDIALHENLLYTNPSEISFYEESLDIDYCETLVNENQLDMLKEVNKQEDIPNKDISSKKDQFPIMTVASVPSIHGRNMGMEKKIELTDPSSTVTLKTESLITIKTFSELSIELSLTSSTSTSFKTQELALLPKVNSTAELLKTNYSATSKNGLKSSPDQEMKETVNVTEMLTFNNEAINNKTEFIKNIYTPTVKSLYISSKAENEFSLMQKQLESKHNITHFECKDSLNKNAKNNYILIELDSKLKHDSATIKNDKDKNQSSNCINLPLADSSLTKSNTLISFIYKSELKIESTESKENTSTVEKAGQVSCRKNHDKINSALSTSSPLPFTRNLKKEDSTKTIINIDRALSPFCENIEASKLTIKNYKSLLLTDTNKDINKIKLKVKNWSSIITDVEKYQVNSDFPLVLSQSKFCSLQIFNDQNCYAVANHFEDIFIDFNWKWSVVFKENNPLRHCKQNTTRDLSLQKNNHKKYLNLKFPKKQKQCHARSKSSLEENAFKILVKHVPQISSAVTDIDFRNENKTKANSDTQLSYLIRFLANIKKDFINIHDKLNRSSNAPTLLFFNQHLHKQTTSFLISLNNDYIIFQNICSKICWCQLNKTCKRVIKASNVKYNEEAFKALANKICAAMKSSDTNNINNQITATLNKGILTAHSASTTSLSNCSELSTFSFTDQMSNIFMSETSTQITYSVRDFSKSYKIINVKYDLNSEIKSLLNLKMSMEKNTIDIFKDSHLIKDEDMNMFPQATNSKQLSLMNECTPKSATINLNNMQNNIALKNSVKKAMQNVGKIHQDKILNLDTKLKLLKNFDAPNAFQGGISSMDKLVKLSLAKNLSENHLNSVELKIDEKDGGFKHIQSIKSEVKLTKDKCVSCKVPTIKKGKTCGITDMDIFKTSCVRLSSPNIVQNPSNSKLGTNLQFSDNTQFTDQLENRQQCASSFINQKCVSSHSQETLKLLMSLATDSFDETATTHPLDCDCFDCLWASANQVRDNSVHSNSSQTECLHDNKNVDTSLVDRLKTVKEEEEFHKNQITEFQELIHKMRDMCKTVTANDAVEKTLLLKRRSSLQLALSSIKLGICDLKNKCKLKDQIIDVMMNELQTQVMDVELLTKFLQSLDNNTAENINLDYLKSLKISTAALESTKTKNTAVHKTRQPLQTLSRSHSPNNYSQYTKTDLIQKSVCTQTKASKSLNDCSKCNKSSKTKSTIHNSENSLTNSEKKKTGLVHQKHFDNCQINNLKRKQVNASGKSKNVVLNAEMLRNPSPLTIKKHTVTVPTAISKSLQEKSETQKTSIRKSTRMNK